MKHGFLLMMLLALSQSAAYGAERSKAEQEIRKLDDQRLAAVLKEDIPMLDHLMTDDFTYTHTSGDIDTKADFLGAMKSNTWKYHSLNLQDVTVRFFGNTAVLTGRCNMTGERLGKDVRMAMHFTEIYVRDNGRWRWLLWQSTRLPSSMQPASATPPANR